MSSPYLYTTTSKLKEFLTERVKDDFIYWGIYPTFSTFRCVAYSGSHSAFLSGIVTLCVCLCFNDCRLAWMCLEMQDVQHWTISY